jgi:hypothetical protein
MLKFYANGEELLTEGFLAPKLTKDGWTLRFTHAFVVLSEISAYRTDPPYDAHSGEEISAGKKVALDGVHLIDLAMGAEDDPPVFVGEAVNAPAGHYNAVSWKMVRGNSGPMAGYSMLLVGTAEKEGKTVSRGSGHVERPGPPGGSRSEASPPMHTAPGRPTRTTTNVTAGLHPSVNGRS